MIGVYKYGTGPAERSRWDAKYSATRVPGQSAYERQVFVQILLKYLPPAGRILDAGCGTGGLAGFLERRGFRVAGVDTSSTAIDIAKQAAPRADLRVASIEALPFPDASFDAYLAIGSWEYPPRGPERAAGEAARVLKPGGLAFIEVPRMNLLRRLLYAPLKRAEYWLRQTNSNTWRLRRFSHHIFSAIEMSTLLTRCGFEVLAVHPHDIPEATRHYGLWVDWPFLRGGSQYELNALGRIVKRLGNALSPWTIATGMFIVARKQ